MRRLFIKKRIREPVVTHDTHATGSPRQTGRRQTQRPDLGRPSLFADFDQESVEDVEPQRIRLLSTLESQRDARGRPRGRRRPTGGAHPWLTRALMTAMGLGMLVMLLSFVQLLRHPQPPLPTRAANAQLPRPVDQRATSALTTPSATPPATEAAEIIDMAPPAGGMPQSPAQALSGPTPPAAPPLVQADAPLVPNGGQHAASPITSRSAQSSAAEIERANRTTAKPNAQRSGIRRDAVTSHEDVALVEAMLAHAGPRKAPPSPSVALQQCGTGSSPETAVCRARVCVQHPSLPACHAP